MSTSEAPLPSTVPDQDALAIAAKLEIFDVNGERVPFSSIFENQKTIVVFIRHFFCGLCHLYVENLASVSQKSLDKAVTKIVVIGCGEWQVIQSYADSTGFTGPIYADPSRALYRALGMNIENLDATPSKQARKSYLTSGRFVVTLQSTWRAFKYPKLLGKQGNISQLGGDFIFGPGLTCTFAWRMQHTEDHVEITNFLENAAVKS